MNVHFASYHIYEYGGWIKAKNELPSDGGEGSSFCMPRQGDIIYYKFYKYTVSKIEWNLGNDSSEANSVDIYLEKIYV